MAQIKGRTLAKSAENFLHGQSARRVFKHFKFYRRIMGINLCKDSFKSILKSIKVIVEQTTQISLQLPKRVPVFLTHCLSELHTVTLTT